MTIVKFIATHIGGFKERYTCNTQGDLTGAYVPLAEYQQLQAENARIQAKLEAELDQLRAGLDELLAKLRDDEAAEVVRVTGRSEWPGEG